MSTITHIPITRHCAALLLCAAMLTLPFCPPLRAQATHHVQDPSSRPPRLALTANLLSWATLAPNLGAELYLAPRWSLAADASFGLWTSSHRTHAFRSWSAGG